MKLFFGQVMIRLPICELPRIGRRSAVSITLEQTKGANIYMSLQKGGGGKKTRVQVKFLVQNLIITLGDNSNELLD
jgi:hypothetical protein